MNQQLYEHGIDITEKPVRPWVSKIITGAVASMLLLVLMYNIPGASAFSTYAGQVLVYALLTAFALFFAVWLSEHDFSAAHAIGMMAFLSLPKDAHALMTWGVFAGGVIGTSALYLIPAGRRSGKSSEFLQDLLFVTARVTLSFFAASQIYIALEGPLPLQHALWDSDGLVALSIMIYSLVYISLYFSIVVLEMSLKGMELLRVIHTNVMLILTILVLPVPFTLLSAELAGRLTTPSEVMGVTGVAVIIIGLHALSRSEYRLRSQLNEMRSLSVAARRMRLQLDMDTLFKTIYRQVTELTGIQNFTVALYDRSYRGLRLALVIRNGKEQSGEIEVLAYAYDNALLNLIYETGASRLIERDVAKAAEQMGLTPPREPMTAFIGVPLLTGDQKLGVMAAHADHSEAQFDSGDLDLLNILAASASIAVENAQLYHEQEARVMQLMDLNRITALLSGTLSPDRVMETIITSSVTLTGAEGVAVYLRRHEHESEEIALVRCNGMSNHFCDHPPVPLMVQNDHGQPKRPIAIMHLATDNRAETVRPILLGEGFAAMLELPLTISDDWMGILALYYRHTKTHNEEQMAVLQMFATQAAQAIDNARMYASTDEAFQRTMDQLLTLSIVGQTLSTSADLSIIGQHVLNHAIDATHSSAGVVVLYNDELHDYEIIASKGYQESALKDAAAFMAQTRHKPSEAASLSFMDNTHLEHNGSTGGARLGVPISHREQEIGCILLESDTPDAYSLEDQHFIAQIANQTVIAIENTRLFFRISEARDRLQAILDAMDEAILMIDLRGQIALANPRIELVGLDPARLLEQNLTDLLADPELELAQRIGFEDPRAVRHLIRDIQSADKDAEHPAHLYVISDPGKEHYIQRLIIPVCDENDQVVAALLVFYDKTREQELAQAREELTRMIVHDLRSPLTAVTTSLRMLQDLITDDNDAYPLIQNTTSASQRAVRKLLSRVDTLLDISKMESGRLAIDPDFTALLPLVESVRSELKPLADELAITINIRVGDEVPLLYVDSDKVERVIMNLADNALKYSPTSSTIEILAHPVDDDRRVQIDVIDNGPGIPDQYKKRLFDSFVQVEDRPKVRRGVGLGLAFCRLVAEAHGGQIWVEDNPDGGSVFSFTLPVSTPDDTPTRRP